MNRSHALGFISLFILGAGTAFVACSSSDVTPVPGVDSGVKDSGGTDTNVGDTNVGDTNVGDTVVATDTNPAADTGPDANPLCTGTPTTGALKSFNFPSQLSKNTLVSATSIIATSPKFLVSFSKTTGSCLYGFFATDGGQTTFGEYSGSLIISYGNKGTVGGTSSTCSEGDSIPTGTKPGDQFDISGTYAAYGPTLTSCTGTPAPSPTKIPEITLCSITAKGTGTLPAPAAVTEADLKNDSTTLPKWVNGWVKVSNVTAGGAVADGGLSPDGGAGATDGFGAFTSVGGLNIADKLYFTAEGAPAIAPGQVFTSIQGISYLDFCSWSLWPTHLTDFAPPPPAQSKGDAATGG